MTGCKSNKWGGSIYVETPEYRFIGKTNSDCSIYQSGIQIFKRSGEAYAVVHRKGKFKRIKRVELLAIVRESGLRELPWLSKKMKVNNKPKITQREMAKSLGLSLGKLNYVLQSLKSKGHIKIENFRNNQNKINYLYLLTPSGISKKTKLTLNFMNLKMREYDELQKELSRK